MVDVVHYAEPVKAKGFVVMDTPGYDPVSMTGIVAGGANVLVFTTGRGSVFGCKPAPSIKVATNTPMYNHMIDDMDINAGVILEGTPVEDGRQGDLREDPGRRQRQEDQERDQRRRRGGVRAVEHRADVVRGVVSAAVRRTCGARRGCAKRRSTENALAATNTSAAIDSRAREEVSSCN